MLSSFLEKLIVSEAAFGAMTVDDNARPRPSLGKEPRLGVAATGGRRAPFRASAELAPSSRGPLAADR